MRKWNYFFLLIIALSSFNAMSDQGKNHLPQADLKLNLEKKFHYAPMPMVLDASQSQGKQSHTIVKYEFDFGDGSPKKLTTTSSVKHIFEILDSSDKKKFVVTLRVQDNEGSWSEPKKKTLELMQIPDPGSKGKNTLAGIDLDQDGIRDDVQLFIAQELKDATPQERAAWRQWAKYNLESLLVANDKEQSIDKNIQIFKAFDCVGYLNKSLRKGETYLFKLIDKTTVILFNTDDRIKAYHKSYGQFSGHITSSVGDSSTCEFDLNSF